MFQFGTTVRSHFARSTLLLAGLFLATACAATSRGPENGPPRASYESDPVTVQIENHAWSTMHVYVLAGGQWKSLGQVTSQGSGVYEVPPGMLGSREEIRLAADPVGRVEAFLSDPILVRPGDAVEWTLQNNLALSSVMVR